MGGDVWQWEETNTAGYGVFRGLCGDSFAGFAAQLNSGAGSFALPSFQHFDYGFRVAEIPEPGSLAMLAGVALAALLCWWRKRA